MTADDTTVLIIGSGPNAIRATAWDRAHFTHIVAINNAWRVRPDWDICIFPEDFPADRHPTVVQPGQSLVEADQYVPIQNQFGGFVYAGGTMAFTAGYWALAALRPAVMAFVGCDMVYPARGNTHFYGTGTADPLRDDLTLQSLEAKSARLALLAAERGCACVNLSQDNSRLLFPRTSVTGLAAIKPVAPDPTALAAAQTAEATLGYMVPSGRYWDEVDRFDPAALRAVDDLWLAAHSASRPAAVPMPRRAAR
ncbi:hypothetical protein [Yoonia sp.]|uniref:hypothetical protein n=1 Tax=Yoonia sp. TaxID=2212373 RepID=UPI0025FE8A7E|nr:hypothetical protein [Yoonia sp.]